MNAVAQQPPKRATVTKLDDRSMRIERIFNAPREKVWKAMTTPDLVAQWWGRGNELVVERMEVERGGHWRFVEHANGQEHGFEGRYADVVPLERFQQTFEWDGMPGHVALETMELSDLPDGRTRMTVVSIFMLAEDFAGMMQSGMEEGMNQSYEALDRVLAAM